MPNSTTAPVAAIAAAHRSAYRRTDATKAELAAHVARCAACTEAAKK